MFLSILMPIMTGLLYYPLNCWSSQSHKTLIVFGAKKENTHLDLLPAFLMAPHKASYCQSRYSNLIIDLNRKAVHVQSERPQVNIG